MKKFDKYITKPDLPSPIPQTTARFGSKKLNVSERDTLKKYRVDPFLWPKKIADKYNLTVSQVIPFRIFVLPPELMEGDQKIFDLLHSDYFSSLPTTYKLIMCSQIRVMFKKNDS